MNIDLHCHTNISDGVLTPNQLIALAIERGIDILSITDHDTLDAYLNIDSVPKQLRLIPGIEFSSQWRKQGIHVVPTMGVPKNSATIAPIIAKVELIFNALRIKGIAFGSRKLKSSRQ